MEQVAISEFKAQMSLSAGEGSEDEKAPLGHKIREAHRRGKSSFSKSKKPKLGSMKREIKFLGDIVSPVFGERDRKDESE